MELVVMPTGTIRYVYAEDVDLSALGQQSVHRGSHVEPDQRGQWWADLAPVQGPRLGPFGLRSAALAAEQVWLTQYWLPSIE